MIGGQAKVWRGGERGDKGVQKDDVGEEEKNREEKELDGPFFAEHRHSLCIISSFRSTYTICSCRLVDILVYVHSCERTHAKSIIGGGEKEGRSM